MKTQHPGYVCCPKCKEEVVAGLSYRLHVAKCTGPAAVTLKPKRTTK